MFKKNCTNLFVDDLFQKYIDYGGADLRFA